MKIASRRPNLRQSQAQHGLDRNLGAARDGRFAALDVADVCLPVIQHVRHLDLRKAQRLPGLLELGRGHGSGHIFFEQTLKLGARVFALVAAQLAFRLFKAKLCMGQTASFVGLTNRCFREGFHCRSPDWASARFHVLYMRLSHNYCKRGYTESASRNVTGAPA